MKIEKTCQSCGKTKPIEQFPRRGKETDRQGNPLYRGKCKKCESELNLAEYHQKKECKNKIIDEVIIPAAIPTEYVEYIPKSKLSGKFVKSDEDYTPWEASKGRPLTDEEKIELDSCARELIIAMLDLVVKEKEILDE